MKKILWIDRQGNKYTKEDINDEYILIHNAAASGKSYLVQLYYYYFVYVDDGEGSSLEWNEMGTSKSAVLNPGESWIFTREKPVNPDIAKFTIEIVATDCGDAEALEEDPVADIPQPLDWEAEYSSQDNATQAVFFEGNKVLGTTIYYLNNSDVYTDMIVDNERLVKANNIEEDKSIQFRLPSGYGNVKWLFFAQ